MQGVNYFGATNPGKLRDNNEDSYIIQNIWDDEHILAVVIDGVGGYAGGEVASELARKSIIEYLERYSDGERIDLLEQAVVYANNVIFSARKTLPQYNNMSCVLTAIVVECQHNRINMAHIGDTRLYQYTNHCFEKLSHDHSYVGYREEIGELTEEEAMKHPKRNIISRDAGSHYLETGDRYIETSVFPLNPKSTLLLCSDGLCDMITSKQMGIILEQELDIKSKVENLILAANDAGGNDNITVILIDIETEEMNVINAGEDVIVAKLEESFDDNRNELKEDNVCPNCDITHDIQIEKNNTRSRKSLMWMIVAFVIGVFVGIIVSFFLYIMISAKK